jgi:hypothetical protein
LSRHVDDQKKATPRDHPAAVQNMVGYGGNPALVPHDVITRM